MPLRDHFHAPLDRESSWEGVHGGWPMMIVADLARSLPPQYVAAPRVHLGAQIEIDIATYERDDGNGSSWSDAASGGGVATAVWSAPQATLSIPADLPAQD